MDRVIIEARDITKIYDSGAIKFQALKGINLQVREGEFVAIMGHSGSGKSTFMNLLGCLDVATEGEIYIDELEISHLNKDELAQIRNRKIGFVFQSYNLLPKTTALENVELPLLYSKEVSKEERYARSAEALERVGLSDLMNNLSNQLSGGQQQRVAIARALVNEPVVILADEPTGNLDTRTSFEVMSIFQELNRQGTTIVLVTHEPDIAAMTKRNVVFKDGRIIKDFVVTQPVDAAAELRKLPVEEEELV